jgi:hypothetical protein
MGARSAIMREQNNQNNATLETVSQACTLSKRNSATQSGPTGGYNSLLGMSGLSKECQGRAKYSGGPEKDLEGVMQPYKALAKTCKISEEEIAMSVHMILDGDAMALYSSKLRAMNFEDIFQALRDEFTSEGQRNQLLQIWKNDSLRGAMRNEPDNSEVEVFKNICRVCSTTQRQLHESFHDDRFLNDQIFIAVEVPEIERSLQKKAAITFHNVIQCVAALLSNDRRSAGAHLIVEDAHDNEGYYGLRIDMAAMRGNRQDGKEIEAATSEA